MARNKKTKDSGVQLTEPQSRAERYLAKIANLDVPEAGLEYPQTRLERYLAKIAGLIEEKPETPRTRLERYLDAIADGGGGSGPAGLGNCLIFTSTSEFTLSVYDNARHWNGNIEWSDGQRSWEIWDGAVALQSAGGFLAVRGTDNSIITGDDENYRWVMSGTNIHCDGNIETLLDYRSVANGEHPIMSPNCYAHLFRGCAALISSPKLSASALSIGCYNSMYRGCLGLTRAPAIPAVSVAASSCNSMFRECTNLLNMPLLHATTLSNNCYINMFNGCAKIKVSTVRTNEYKYEYRIPDVGTGTVGIASLGNMFNATGGPFDATPDANTIYYTDHPPVDA